jgi:hypothetical protein
VLWWFDGGVESYAIYGQDHDLVRCQRCFEGWRGRVRAVCCSGKSVFVDREGAFVN